MTPLTLLAALRDLGWEPLWRNALYRLGLHSGHFRRVSVPAPAPAGDWMRLAPFFPFPSAQDLQSVLGQEGEQTLLQEAREVAKGLFRPFGGEWQPIHLLPPSPLRHWSEYETHPAALPPSDIKQTWEPARFGWAFTLGRAYTLRAKEDLAAAFWQQYETFWQHNPPYQGPHWMSGQEVGLRLMALAWAGQALEKSPHSTPARKQHLAAALALHAERIPLTLGYALSQNNNHLLSEAAALYTASLALPQHPQAAQWRKTGSHWLRWGFTHQIEENGEYVQHSLNYHRLMLQLALWVNACAAPEGEGLDAASRAKLNKASLWLLNLTDPLGGRAPNLGHNDGAYILPLSNQPYPDLRPVAQAAWLAFCAPAPLQAGAWDEMSLWLGLLPNPRQEKRLSWQQILTSQRRMVYQRYSPPLPTLVSPSGNSWAHLRTPWDFHSRPAHGDLLHLDLWRRGENLTLDPGTYAYNAAPPWQNALTHAAFHNTLTLGGADHFTRAGKFLYLGWRQIRGRYTLASADRFNLWHAVSASHNAYEKNFGARHNRQVYVNRAEAWTVTDSVEYPPRWRHLFGELPLKIRLHWLLPDWNYEIRNNGTELRLQSPQGWVLLRVKSSTPAEISLARAGEMLFGKGQAEPQRGWFSPTYLVKVPALSLAVEVLSAREVSFISEFLLPEESDDPLRLQALAANLVRFANLLQTALPNPSLPEDEESARELLKLLRGLSAKLLEGDIAALEEYRYFDISPAEWRQALGKAGEALLKEIEQQIEYFRLY